MGPAQPISSAAPSSSTPVSLSTLTATMPMPPATIEQLPANIPQLELNGSNWAIFMMHFKDAMQVTQQWGYFAGLKPHPKVQDMDTPTDDKLSAIEQWEHDDLVASYLLSQCLPDITVICLSSFATAKEWWDIVTKEFQAKSTFTQADLHQSFQEMHCTKGGMSKNSWATCATRRKN